MKLDISSKASVGFLEIKNRNIFSKKTLKTAAQINIS